MSAAPRRGLLRERALPAAAEPLPRAIRVFLREAERRIKRFRREHRVPGFVPCDFAQAAIALQALAAADVAPGRLFCEWGSGFGVVACLAAMLEFDAHGIEIDDGLVEAACELAEDFGLPVQFVRGSFLQAQDGASLEPGREFAWLATSAGGAWEELGLTPADMAVTFAYPWPDEELLIESLFARHAAPGALLLTYHEDRNIRLRQKTTRAG